MTFFSSAIVGPGFDYYDFRIFINRELNYEKIPFIKSIFQSLKLFIMSVIYAGVFMFVYPKFDVQYILT